MDLAGNVCEWVVDRCNCKGFWGLLDAHPLNLEPAWNWSVWGSSWFSRPESGDPIAEDRRSSARNTSHSSDDSRRLPPASGGDR